MNTHQEPNARKIGFGDFLKQDGLIFTLKGATTFYMV